MLVAIMPPDWRPVDTVQAKLAEQVKTQDLHRTLEEVRAVDLAFTSTDDRSDAAFGAIGLTLAGPWLIDILTDALQPRTGAEDEQPKPRPRDEEDK